MPRVRSRNHSKGQSPKADGEKVTVVVPGDRVARWTAVVSVLIALTALIVTVYEHNSDVRLQQPKLHADVYAGIAPNTGCPEATIEVTNDGPAPLTIYVPGALWAPKTDVKYPSAAIITELVSVSSDPTLKPGDPNPIPLPSGAVAEFVGSASPATTRMLEHLIVTHNIGKGYALLSAFGGYQSQVTLTATQESSFAEEVEKASASRSCRG